MTDSFALQELTIALGIDCKTISRNTDRPITMTHGTTRRFDLDYLGVSP